MVRKREKCEAVRARLAAKRTRTTQRGVCYKKLGGGHDEIFRNSLPSANESSASLDHEGTQFEQNISRSIEAGFGCPLFNLWRVTRERCVLCNLCRGHE